MLLKKIYFLPPLLPSFPPCQKILMKDIVMRILMLGKFSLTNGILGKPCQELQNCAIICERRTHVMPELRVTTLTDRTVKRIQEKVTAELRFATRRDKEL